MKSMGCIHPVQLLICVIVLSTVTPINAMVSVFPSGSRAKGATSVFANLTPDQFISLTSKDLKSITGKRPTLREKIILKLTQRKAKKMMKKGTNFDLAAAQAEASGDFNVGGFLLGFFFSLIGVLIAILFGGNAVRSALIGALCGLLVAVVAVLV